MVDTCTVYSSLDNLHSEVGNNEMTKTPFTDISKCTRVVKKDTMNYGNKSLCTLKHDECFLKRSKLSYLTPHVFISLRR